MTFSPTQQGFSLAMNRDEQLTRPLALGPEILRKGDLEMLYPREPSGGAWIGVNNRGLILALINWYSAPYSIDRPARSRGVIIPRLLESGLQAPGSVAVRQLGLEQFNPFRLLTFWPPTHLVQEWAWNGKEVLESTFPWHRRHWFSSGYEEAEAGRVRGKTADKAGELTGVGSLPWIRELHASHQPQRGAFSVCMHRSDARTVSYTEIQMEKAQAIMNYRPDSPCLGQPMSRHLLALV